MKVKHGNAILWCAVGAFAGSRWSFADLAAGGITCGLALYVADAVAYLIDGRFAKELATMWNDRITWYCDEVMFGGYPDYDDYVLNADRHLPMWQLKLACMWEVFKHYVNVTLCKWFDHRWESDDFGGPESGYAGAHCERCGHSVGGYLY